MGTIISSCVVHCRIETLHELSHAWLAVFDNHFDKNSIQSEARDPNDATAKRDLGSLASPVGALRMEAANSLDYCPRAFELAALPK